MYNPKINKEQGDKLYNKVKEKEGLISYIKNLAERYQNKNKQSGVELSKLVEGVNNFANQYFYISSISHGEIIYVSNVERVLGYAAKDFDLNTIIDIIHPMDRPVVNRISTYLLERTIEISPITPFEGMVSLDYRVKCADGKYIRIMRQSVICEVDKDGKPTANISICTNINHIKTDDNIGCEITSNIKDMFDFEAFVPKSKKTIAPLSIRQLEILWWIARGLNSRDIGSKLYISKNTVDTHRRKMLKLAEVNNTSELISIANTNGWI